MAITKAERARRQAEREDCAATLRKWFSSMPQVNTLGEVEVRCLVTRVNREDSSRRIKVLGVVGGEILNMSYRVGKALDLNVNDDGVRVTGGGMDMGFHLVSTLGVVLYGPGNDYKIRNRWL